MIVFPRAEREAVGTGHHRSGWPFVVNYLYSLKNMQTKHRILFDDFVERSFSYDLIPEPYTEDWGGIFHHPPHMPNFAVDDDKWETIFSTDLWKISSGNLKFAIFTTEHQEIEFSEIYPEIPTFVAMHPTDTEVPQWSPDAYRDLQYKKVIQVGSYLRNTRAIYMIPGIAGIHKVRLFPGIRWLRRFDRKVSDYLADRGYAVYHPVASIRHVDDRKYDWMLSNSIILSMPLNASACNVVVECMARCTPLMVPKINPIVEYLGQDYPLYVDDDMLADKEKMKFALSSTVFEAYDYMRGMDKEFLDVNRYVSSIENFIAGVLDPNTRMFG